MRPNMRESVLFYLTWKPLGVSVKPIKLISGLSPFCETFLDDVRGTEIESGA